VEDIGKLEAGERPTIFPSLSEADQTGRSTPGEQHQGDQSDPKPEILIDLLRQEYYSDGHLVFAGNLEARGVFDELKQAGILPKADDPNGLILWYN
jgi:hypothetical protein